MRYGIRITDFHSHVLPGADHGSDSVETSERQLELLNGAGIDRVVAAAFLPVGCYSRRVP